MKLETTATRVVMGGLVHCTLAHPLSVLNSLLIPLVSSSAGWFYYYYTFSNIIHFQKNLTEMNQDQYKVKLLTELHLLRNASHQSCASNSLGMEPTNKQMIESIDNNTINFKEY